MKKKVFGRASIVTFLMLMSVSMVFAQEKQPLTPQLAAKKHMVEQQKEQRITQDKRKVASDGLKAERLKIYKAKEAQKRSRDRSHSNQ